MTGGNADGTTAECAHLHLLLACFRASPPPMRLPGVTGRPLPEVLAAGIIDPDVFHTGYAIMAARYGRTYTAPDIPGDGPTRNLGIVMEGATDAARQAAQSSEITSAGLEAGLLGLAFAEVTGTITVTLRYRALLSELDASPTNAHSHIVAAMISGDLAPLETWRDARDGPGSFARMFRAPSSGAELELVR